MVYQSDILYISVGNFVIGEKWQNRLKTGETLQIIKYPFITEIRTEIYKKSL